MGGCHALFFLHFVLRAIVCMFLKFRVSSTFCGCTLFFMFCMKLHLRFPGSLFIVCFHTSLAHSHKLLARPRNKLEVDDCEVKFGGMCG